MPFLAAGSHPDHHSLASFRRRFLDELSGLFEQVLKMAQEMKILKLGTISLDGTKITAHALRHSVLSHGHIEQLEVQLKDEVASWLAMAEQADQSALPEWSCRQRLPGVKHGLPPWRKRRPRSQRAPKARFEKEQAEHESKRACREATAQEAGRPPPKPPIAGPTAQEQINLTDEQSRIMPVAGGGFEQAYNAQAAVDTSSMLVVIPAVTQAGNDEEQVLPILERVVALPASLGQVERRTPGISAPGIRSLRSTRH